MSDSKSLLKGLNAAFQKENVPVKNRFLVRCSNNLDIYEWCVKSCKKPSYDFKNHKYDDTLKLGIYISSKISDDEIIKKFENYNKNFSETDYIVIEELDPEGHVMETYSYFSPYITKIDFDEYDYSDDRHKSYVLTIKVSQEHETNKYK